MFHHITVLLNEAIDGLNIQNDGIYVDCTLGGAGHSRQIASRLTSGGWLIGIDQDEKALEHAGQMLDAFNGKIDLVKSNFSHLEEILRDVEVPQSEGVPQVDGILFDLGVSSPQLDDAERGFSYNQDAELDMRMDRSSSLTAFHIVNEWPEDRIASILHHYGEEKFARRIAKHIIQYRDRMPIESTGQLSEIIKEAIPAATRRSGPHPAKRSFQAIRIAVNDELGVLEEALEQAVRCTAPGGRIAVITFHSLEDRICKQLFAKYVEKCTCPPDFPICVCPKKGMLKLINRKPIVPGTQELEANPRARSAKLRIVEKL